jgi:hypothetical protein
MTSSNKKTFGLWEGDESHGKNNGKKPNPFQRSEDIINTHIIHTPPIPTPLS